MRVDAKRLLLLSTAAGALVSAAGTAMPAFQDAGGDKSAAVPAPPTLEETRLVMEKWIQTQQAISKERKEWQQGKDILLGRLELVKQEVASLQKKIGDADASAKEAAKKRDALLAENDELKATGTKLVEAVSRMEGEVRRLWKSLPDPITTRLQPLYQRMPENNDDATKKHISASERFQNVLGILNEINKANNELTVNYEVHDLSDGKPAEVKALYVGLAQAYFVSAKGEAGVGRPSPDGWKWETSKTIGNDVLLTLEIMQGKQTPAFVGLPVKIR